MTEPFTASPMSADIVATGSSAWSRSELHARMFLARYPNPRTRQGYSMTLKQFFGWCAEIGIEPLDARRNHIELFCRDLEMNGRTEGQPLINILRKGGKWQRIPLHPKPAWLLEQVIDGREAGPVFCTSTGNRVDRRVVGRIVRDAAFEAGITKRVTPHSLRHAFVTLSLDSGRSERDVAASVGHADTRLVAYYDRGRDHIARNTTYSVASLIEGSM